MTKRRITYLIGAIIIGISFMLIAFLILLASGIIDTRSKLVFISGSTEKIYDGTPLTLDEYVLASGELQKNHTVSVTVSGSRTNAGAEHNLFTVEITDRSGSNVTDNYNIEYVFGELKVTARTIGIKTESAAKIYDGTPLVCDEYSLIGDTIVDGHDLFVDVVGERTEAGISENLFMTSVKDLNGDDVTSNYYIEKLTGVLEVQKLPISISTPSYHKVYDGDPLTLNEWSYASKTQILKNQQIEVTVVGSQTDIGSCFNSVGGTIITDNGENVTHNYEITFIEGELIVTPRQLTVRSDSDIKTYDGTPLINPNWSVYSITPLVEGHRIDAATSGSQLAPGNSPNYFAQVIILAEDEDVTFNYNIECQAGILTVLNADGTRASDSSGSGSVNLNESGVIGSDNGGGDKNTVAVRVNSDADGKIYLRYRSFVDFTGQKWYGVVSYETGLPFSMNYMTGIGLKNAGYESTKISIEVFGDNYLLPYYLDTFPLDYDIQNNDTISTGITDYIYSLYYYPFDYVSTGLNRVDLKEYVEYEQRYATFVMNNYRTVPNDTKAFMQAIIEENDFEISSPTVIADVAKFITESAIYNEDYDRQLDNESDIAVSFFDYGEGICQHYATAATMLYRALGFPARYTIGYVGTTQAGAWVDIFSENAHAWVEVYVQGLGWVQVEVTDSDIGNGNGGDNGGGGGTDVKFDLSIRPVDLFMKYKEGTVLNAQNRLLGLDSLIEQGYTYSATVTGKQSLIGISYSTIVSFTLYNSNGEDITSSYKITFGKGKLQIYAIELTVTTNSLTKIYDGTPLSLSAEDCTVDGKLIEGHQIKSITPTGNRTDVGQSENSYNIVIVDSNGADITYMYKLNKMYGMLTVKAREITVKAGSDEKKYDGNPLICDSFEIIDTDTLPLLDGDKITVVTSGAQTNVGISENTILSIKIVNKTGGDVTANYHIMLENGTLRVYR